MPSTWSRASAKETKGRSLILNGHIDVVPTGPLDLWTQPPFARASRTAGLCRGSATLKGGLVAALAAFDAVDRLAIVGGGGLSAVVIEEECTATVPSPAAARLSRRCGDIPEPAENGSRHGAARRHVVQVKVRGRPTHVGHAGRGVNAIESCFPIVAALHKLEDKWNASRHELWADHPHPINSW